MNRSLIAELSPTNSLRTIGSKFWLLYLAVPYKRDGRDTNGWDCFGAVRYVLQHHANLELPMFDTMSAAEIARQSRKSVWHLVREPKQFDVVCLDIPRPKGRRPLHLGVMVEENRCLHCDEGCGTVCVPLDHFTIKGRVSSIYRHERLL